MNRCGPLFRRTILPFAIRSGYSPRHTNLHFAVRSAVDPLLPWTLFRGTILPFCRTILRGSRFCRTILRGQPFAVQSIVDFPLLYDPPLRRTIRPYEPPLTPFAIQ